MIPDKVAAIVTDEQKINNWAKESLQSNPVYSASEGYKMLTNLFLRSNILMYEFHLTYQGAESNNTTLDSSLISKDERKPEIMSGYGLLTDWRFSVSISVLINIFIQTKQKMIRIMPIYPTNSTSTQYGRMASSPKLNLTLIIFNNH